MEFTNDALHTRPNLASPCSVNIYHPNVRLVTEDEERNLWDEILEDQLSKCPPLTFVRRTASTGSTNARLKSGNDSKDGSKCAVKSTHSQFQGEVGTPDVHSRCQPEDRGGNVSNALPLGVRGVAQAEPIAPQPITVEGACGPIDNSRPLTITFATVPAAMVSAKALVSAARPRASAEATIALSMVAEGRAKGTEPRDTKEGRHPLVYGGRPQKKPPSSRVFQQLDNPVFTPHTGGARKSGRSGGKGAGVESRCRKPDGEKEGNLVPRSREHDTAGEEGVQLIN